YSTQSDAFPTRRTLPRRTEHRLPPPSPSLLPYTTLFRSELLAVGRLPLVGHGEFLFGADESLIEQGRGGDHLRRRAWFEHIGEDARAAVVAVDLARRVRVDGGGIGGGDDPAGLDLLEHDGGGFGRVRLARLLDGVRAG